MNYSTAVMLINPNIRAVKGRYEEHGKDTVFKTIDKSLAVGDFVVVESDTRWDMTTVKITEVDVEVDFDSSAPMGWVLQKIDVAAHKDLKVMEEKAIELIKKGEIRKRREDIKKNTLDALSAGEIEGMTIARIGNDSADEQKG